MRDERGVSISVFVTVAMVFLILAVGIGVDFSGHVAAEQHARHVAQEAARAGGQEVLAYTGVPCPPLNPSAATLAARAYLGSSDYHGDVIVGTHRIEVTIQGATYQTRFLSIIGINSLPIRASGSSLNVCVGG